MHIFQWYQHTVTEQCNSVTVTRHIKSTPSTPSSHWLITVTWPRSHWIVNVTWPSNCVILLHVIWVFLLFSMPNYPVSVKIIYVQSFGNGRIYCAYLLKKYVQSYDQLSRSFSKDPLQGGKCLPNIANVYIALQCPLSQVTWQLTHTNPLSQVVCKVNLG